MPLFKKLTPRKHWLSSFKTPRFRSLEDGIFSLKPRKTGNRFTSSTLSSTL